MALLTLAKVRENIETGLGDDALQRVMDSVEDDIDQRHGAVASEVDDLVGGLKSIWTTRPILSITSIVETVDNTDTTLATNDWTKRHDTQLSRDDDGTNSRQRWGDRVKITYVPVDTTNRRIMAYLKLIQLELVYSGYGSSKEGDFNSSALDYEAEREKILGSLSRKGMFM
jgi:hypothetical protein